MSGKGGYGSSQPPSAPPPSSAAPPNYAAPPQYAQENVAVIVQPSMTTPLVQPERRRRPEIGLVALVLAIISTALFAICGCWWALPCAVVGIILGATSTASGDTGDADSAKNQMSISICCTIAGWVTMVVGLGILIGVVFALSANNDNNDQ